MSTVGDNGIGAHIVTRLQHDPKTNTFKRVFATNTIFRSVDDAFSFACSLPLPEMALVVEMPVSLVLDTRIQPRTYVTATPSTEMTVEERAARDEQLVKLGGVNVEDILVSLCHDRDAWGGLNDARMVEGTSMAILRLRAMAARRGLRADMKRIEARAANLADFSVLEHEAHTPDLTQSSSSSEQEFEEDAVDELWVAVAHNHNVLRTTIFESKERTQLFVDRVNESMGPECSLGRYRCQRFVPADEPALPGAEEATPVPKLSDRLKRAHRDREEYYDTLLDLKDLLNCGYPGHDLMIAAVCDLKERYVEANTERYKCLERIRELEGK